MGIIKYVSFIIIYLISEISISQEFQTIIQSGHSVSVNSLCFSKEGRYLFSHDKEGTVKTWDLKSGLLLSSIVCDATQGMVVNENETIELILFGYSNFNIVNPIKGEIKKEINIREYLYGNAIDDIILYQGSDAILFSIKSSDPYIFVYSLANDSIAGEAQFGYNSPIYDIDLSHHHHHIALMKQDSVSIVEIKTGKLTSFANAPDDRMDGHLELSFNSTDQYIMFNNFKNIRVLDLNSGEEIFSTKAQIACWGSGDTIFCDDAKGNIIAFDVVTGNQLFQFNSNHQKIDLWAITSMGYSAKLNFLATAYKGEILLWNANNGESIWKSPAHIDGISSLSTHPNKAVIATDYAYNNHIKLWDLSNLTQKNLLIEDIISLEFNNTGEILIANKLSDIMETNKEHKTLIYNYADDEIIAEFPGCLFDYQYDPINNSLAYIAGDFYNNPGQSPNGIIVCDLNTNSKTDQITINNTNWVQDLCLHDNLLFYSCNTGENNQIDNYYIGTYDLSKQKIIQEQQVHFTLAPYNFKLSLSNNGKYLAYSSSYDVFFINRLIDEKQVISGISINNGTIENLQAYEEDKFIIGTDKGYVCIVSDVIRSEFQEFKCHDGAISGIALSSDKQKIITTANDGQIKIWNRETMDLILTIINIEENDYVIFTPDNYYMASRGVKSGIGFKKDSMVYHFEQFDLIYNRPDIIMKRLGYASEELVDIYFQAYHKRLASMNVHPRQFNDSITLPQIYIGNLESINIKTQDPFCLLDIKAVDETTHLDRLNIWVNDIPIYGKKGLRLNIRKAYTFDKKINLLLSPGRNKIQLSCLNQNGVESLKKTLVITYDPEEIVKPDLYIVAISVSEYEQDEMNLQYAVKDGRDITEQFLLENDQWNEIFIDTLFDQAAGRDSIITLKEKLLKTNVDDQVVLFVSGHGLLDDNFDFYFATHDIDFNNPSERGISYDELEWLLDSIPARKKLFLMDACHSGEVDKDGLMAYHSDTTQKNLKKGVMKYTPRVGAISSKRTKKLGLQNSFKLMQELFTNLNRGSGAVVISAAAGDSWAMEADEWQNGVFTYSILNGMKTMDADLNNDGEITVSELRDYVSESVQDLTNGLQKPTMRQENVEFDFRVW